MFEILSVGRLQMLLASVVILCAAVLCAAVRADDPIQQLSFNAIAGSRPELDVGAIACRRQVQARTAAQPPPPAAAPKPRYETRWVCQGRYCIPMRVQVQ